MLSDMSSLWIIVFAIIIAYLLVDGLEEPSPRVQDTNGYMMFHSRLVQIPCDKPHMMLKQQDNDKPRCQCIGNYYLQLGNINVAETAKCWPCKDCSNTTYLIKDCGIDYPTLCCPHPETPARMTEYGHYECVNDYFVTIHMGSEAFVISCSKNNMNLRTNGEGKRSCDCSDGYFLNPGSMHDPSRAICEKCKVCGEKDHTIRNCTKYEQTLCCPDPLMEARPTSQGFYHECYLPLNKTHLPVVTTTIDEHQVEKKIHSKERCPDGSTAKKTPHGLGCTDSTTQGQSQVGKSGDPEEQSMFPRIPFMILIIVTMLVLVVVVLVKTRKGRFGPRGNEYELASMKE